jgi:glycosyltransferase involved in cell wall biosynthesis
MRVSLVTTWDTACGIAEYGYYWKEAVEQADREIEVEPLSDLHPAAVGFLRQKPDWVWLNYHAALHSQWRPEDVRNLRDEGMKVGITYHDTGVPNSEQCRALHAVADAFVIHEPAEDLPGAIYLRQGVPGWHSPFYTCKPDGRAFTGTGRPVVGSIGFPFPWKNYDLLVEASALAGWGVLLIAPTATEKQLARWRTLNPESGFRTDFVPRHEALAILASCDATAFLYANANTGTSAAIRQGIAARKPVIATSAGGCRQFRDLDDDPVARMAIRWIGDLTVEKIADALSYVEPLAWDPHVVRLAYQDSWASRGDAYARILTGGL